jgi:hypothetical protein
MKKCDKAISEKMILYLPYVKPSQYLNEENRNKLSAGVTYKTTKIHEFVQFPSKGNWRFESAFSMCLIPFK